MQKPCNHPTYLQMLSEGRVLDRPPITREMVVDCQYVHDEESFFNLIREHTGSYSSREKYLYCFYRLWDSIPAECLYPIYCELISEIQIFKGRSWYVDFFKPEILKVIIANNKHDTVENSKLNSLLDKNGFLTVYHVTCNKTMHNAHSWCLTRGDALIMGQLRACFLKDPNYYCVTGKVKLDDIIALVTIHSGRNCVVVLQKNVREKTKEILDYTGKEVIQAHSLLI